MTDAQALGPPGLVSLWCDRPSAVKLARYQSGDQSFFGSVHDGFVVEMARPTLAGIRDEPLLSYLAGECTDGPHRHLDDVRLLSPLARPGKIVGIGLNYGQHAAETGMALPKAPVLFAKFPSSLIGPGDAIVYSAADSKEVDFEVELGVIIGRECRRVSEASALAHVVGYTIANDVTARDVQFGEPQWVRGKSFDTFCPLGPWIVTADELGDPQGLSLRCYVNDRLLQDGSTSDMIFGVAEIISYVSQSITLDPGDLLLTGTPWGVGFARTPPVFLRDGDVCRVAIEGIGEMVNPVRVRGLEAAGGRPDAGANSLI